MKPELLSPAGSFDALVAAVQNGADAVYIGGKEFNARINSDNFSHASMKSAIDYCHVRGVKVYAAVNTLVSDDELSSVLEYVRNLYVLGIDAVIVQDIGLFYSVRKIFPDLPIHASTQMTVHNSGGALLLKNMGAKKVIVSREMELKDIIALKGIPVETFCHGAICMSYSGQCLMSSFMFGRSGNRGVCAQPCRLKYSLSGGGEPSYLLSPHDLSTFERMDLLCDSGISALKIEGRMRSPEYVACVTSAYRSGIDTGKSDNKSDLSKVFNRGFTGGFILSDSDNMMNEIRQNNLGMFLGKCISYDHKTRLMKIRLVEDLCVGDGLRIDSDDEIGYRVKSILTESEKQKEARKGDTVSLKVQGQVVQGSPVYKTFDKKLDTWAKDTYLKGKDIRKIGIDVTVKLKEGQPLLLSLSDGDNKVCSKSSFLAEKAVKHPMTSEKLLEQMSRLGNTPFSIKRFVPDVDDNLMVPLSEVSRVRKEAVRMLEAARMAVLRKMDEKSFFERVEKTIVLFHKSKIKRTNISVHVDDVKSAVESVADEIIIGNGFDPKGKADIMSMSKSVRDSGKILVLATPAILTDAEVACVLDVIKKCGPDKVLVSNLGLLKELSGSGIDIYLDYPLNVYNSQSAKAFLRIAPDVRRICVSVELALSKIREMKFDADIECVVYGRLALMTSEHCIFKSKCSMQCEKGICLVDRIGMKFPVKGAYGCRMHPMVAIHHSRVRKAWL